MTDGRSIAILSCDIANDKPINIPCNYYSNNDPTQRPRHTWRSLGYLLFNNWLSEIYRDTPFDLASLPEFLKQEGVA